MYILCQSIWTCEHTGPHPHRFTGTFSMNTQSPTSIIFSTGPPVKDSIRIQSSRILPFPAQTLIVIMSGGADHWILSHVSSWSSSGPSPCVILCDVWNRLLIFASLCSEEEGWVRRGAKKVNSWMRTNLFRITLLLKMPEPYLAPRVVLDKQTIWFQG